MLQQNRIVIVEVVAMVEVVVITFGCKSEMNVKREQSLTLQCLHFCLPCGVEYRNRRCILMEKMFK